MKALISTLLLSIASIVSLFAQNWADSSSVWYYNQPTSDFSLPVTAVYYKMTYQGDTIIEGVQCNIIGDTANQEYMYLDEGMVYYWQFDDFHVVYDFTAEQGDTIELTYRAELNDSDTILDVKGLVESVYPVTVSTHQLTQFWVRILPISEFPLLVLPTVIYTEAIGSETEMIEVLRMPTVIDLPLLRCFKSDTLDYVTSWWQAESIPCDYQTRTDVSEAFYQEEPKIFPNPANSVLNVEIPRPSNDLEIRVVNLLGIEIYRTTGKQTTTVTINLDNASKGIHFLQILQSGQSSTYTVIKQ